MNFTNTLRQWLRQWRFPTYRRGAVAMIAGVASLGGVASHFLGGPAWLTDTLWLAAAAVAGSEIALRAFSALRARIISIELLVTIAAVGAILIGEYWESAAVTFLFVLGGYLEARTMARTRSALKDLLALAPTEVTVQRDGNEITNLARSGIAMRLPACSTIALPLPSSNLATAETTSSPLR